MIERLHWLGHASFQINGGQGEDGPIIYIDPWDLPSISPPADVILISHDHHDHCSPGDVAQIRKATTIIIANQRAAVALGSGVQVLHPWQGAVNVGDVSISAVPAYTVTAACHAPSFGGLGFIVSMMRHDVYYAGDTDLIPEMDRIGCDIAILPVGGHFTMSWEQAVEAVNRLRPKYAVPMHYGREITDSRDYGYRFCSRVGAGVQAIELPIENESFQLAYD